MNKGKRSVWPSLKHSHKWLFSLIHFIWKENIRLSLHRSLPHSQKYKGYTEKSRRIWDITECPYPSLLLFDHTLLLNYFLTCLSNEPNDTKPIFCWFFKASIYCLFKAEMSYKTLTFLIFSCQPALCHRDISCDLCHGEDEILLTPDRESIHWSWKVHCTSIQDKGSWREIILAHSSAFILRLSLSTLGHFVE